MSVINKVLIVAVLFYMIMGYTGYFAYERSEVRDVVLLNLP